MQERSLRPLVIRKSSLIQLFVAFAAFLFTLLSISLSLFSNSVSYKFSLAFAVYIVILWMAYFIHRGKGKIDLLEPYWVFIGIYSLYAWGAAFRVDENHGITYVGVYTTPEAFTIYLICIDIGLLGFILGYWYLVRKNNYFKSSLEKIVLRARQGRFTNYLLLAALLLSLLTLPDLINALRIGNSLAYGDITSQARLEIRSDVNQGIGEFITQIPNILLISALFILTKRKSIFWKILFVGYLLLSSVAGLSRGSRGILIDNAFFFLLFYHYRVRRINISWIIIAAIPMYLILTTIQHVRTTTNLVYMFNTASSLVRNDPRILLPSSIGEFAAPSGNLIILIDGINQGISNFTYGASVLTELATWIPRPLFPGRPLPLPDLYTQIFLPSFYYSGHGAGFFLLMEGYWAFGIVGVLIEMLILGGIVRICYDLFIQYNDRDFVFILYALAYPSLVILSIRTGFLGTFKYILMTVAPIFFFVLLSRVVIFKRKKALEAEV